MHFRKRSTAPIEPQSTSCSAGFLVGASTGAIVDLAKPCAYFGCRFRMSQLLAFGFVYSLFISGSAICSADQLKDLAEKAGIRILADGDSSASAEDEARAAIPLKSMTQENRQRAQQIIKDRSQYRRVP